MTYIAILWYYNKVNQEKQDVLRLFNYEVSKNTWNLAGISVNP